MRGTLRNSIWLSTILIMSTVARVAAHAELVRSEPAANARLAESPRRVTLWFDEELDTGKSTVQVLDAKDQQVDQRDGHVDLDDPDHASMIVTLPALPEGVYTVRWRAVTIDDDGVIEGEFDFVVGNAEPRVKTTPAEIPPLLILAAGAFVVVMIITVGLVWRATNS